MFGKLKKYRNEMKNGIQERLFRALEKQYHHRKQHKNINTENLCLFNRRPGEPESSVMESGDYEFAVSKYNSQDFRYKFVQKYFTTMKEEYNVEIYNCKFERPTDNSNFVNFYIYVYENTSDVFYRIDDKNNKFYKTFFKAMTEIGIKGLNQKSKVQIILRNIHKIMYGKILDDVWHEISKSICIKFPEVAMLSYWSNLYVFITGKHFNKILANIDRLQKIKRYCYDTALKYDTHKILYSNKFKIRVDNIENYRAIGGQNYYNSDCMFDCPLI